MSYMERSNWKDPSHQRRFRIFIPLAAALVLAVGVIVAVKSNVGLTAFGGSTACPSPSLGTPAPGPGHRKGAESVKHGARPAAKPTAQVGPVVPAQAAQGGQAAQNGTAQNGTTQNGTTNGQNGTAQNGTAQNGQNGTANGQNGQAAQANPSSSAGAGTQNGTQQQNNQNNQANNQNAQQAVQANCKQQQKQQQQQAAANPNPNCTLIVPPNPLTAQGLATPYQLMATNAGMGPCNEANANQSAFVQASIIDPATGKVSVYSPLVVDRGTQPAVAPTPPNLPAGAVVGIWFGFNGTNLTLRDMNGSLQQGTCVNGLGNSVFGQFAYCNATAFFQAANTAIQNGQLTVPPLGTANDGMPCPSTRDFSLIDQDQSDNVQTTYLANGKGQIAQNTAANMAQLANATTLSNPSDNALLDVFVDPALGCQAAMVPDLTNNGAMTFSLAMDELQAAAGQAAPAALVPQNDPMVLVNNNMSQQKTNLYRAGVDQQPLPAGQTPAQYCMQMDTIQAARLQKDMAMLANKASPMPAAANNLFTFLGMRLQGSFGNLNCQNFGLQNPVANLVMQNNVVVGVQFANAANGGNNNGGNNNGGNNGGAASPTASPTAPNGMNNGGGAASPTASPSTPAANQGGYHYHYHHHHRY